nr:exocyst complex component EXO84A-like [Tanacetum cinerariifolium]
MACGVSREIYDLKGQLIALRNILSNRATIIHTLAEGVDLIFTEDGIGRLNAQSKIENQELSSCKDLDVIISKRESFELLGPSHLTSID